MFKINVYIGKQVFEKEFKTKVLRDSFVKRMLQFGFIVDKPNLRTVFPVHTIKKIELYHS